MEKFCVFCGRGPQEKNKEHVIPAWLIEKTGKPNRLAHFGLDLNKTPPALRKFAFNSLTFPACRVCNSRFSSLEAAAKPVIESVLARAAVSRDGFITLFDWLDKVRVGLWLGYIYLDKNPEEITPTYHIETRIGQTDRSMAIFHIHDRNDGINFYGPESPCFQNQPTCFAILINKWCFLNVVGVSSISRRLGFPYMQPLKLRDDGKFEGESRRGTERVMRPVLPGFVFAKSTKLHQPIYSGRDSEERSDAFRDEWVRSRCIDSDHGVGSVFIERDETVDIYPSHPSLDWLPESSWSLAEIYSTVQPFVLRYMAKDLERSAGLAMNPVKRGLLSKLAVCRRVHSAIVAMNRKALN